MKTLTRHWNKFFLTPSTGEALSVLRIVVGLMMFLKALFLLPHADDLYGQFGYLQSHLMESISGGNLTTWAAKNGIVGEQYSTYLHIFFVVHIVSAFTFMIGFQTKISNVVLWVTQTLLFRLAWVSAYGIDSYCQNFCFMMLWLPVGRFWSIDSLIRKPNLDPLPLCTLGLRCLQMYLLLTYVDAGFSKSVGVDWWNGAAIWKVLHFPEFNHINFFWLAEYPWIPKLLAWGTLFFECFYIVGAWIPRVGRLWTLVIISMHLGIAFLMGLTLFGITLALVNFALFLYPIQGWKSLTWRRFPARLALRLS